MANAVAKPIEDLCERGGLTGVDVANVAGVSRATVSRWSSGKAAPQPRTQLVLSDLRYVVDLSEFYTPRRDENVALFEERAAERRARDGFDP